MTRAHRQVQWLGSFLRDHRLGNNFMHERAGNRDERDSGMHEEDSAVPNPHGELFVSLLDKLSKELEG